MLFETKKALITDKTLRFSSCFHTHVTTKQNSCSNYSQETEDRWDQILASC